MVLEAKHDDRRTGTRYSDTSRGAAVVDPGDPEPDRGR